MKSTGPKRRNKKAQETDLLIIKRGQCVNTVTMTFVIIVLASVLVVSTVTPALVCYLRYTLSKRLHACLLTHVCSSTHLSGKVATICNRASIRPHSTPSLPFYSNLFSSIHRASRIIHSLSLSTYLSLHISIALFISLSIHLSLHPSFPPSLASSLSFLRRSSLSHLNNSKHPPPSLP